MKQPQALDILKLGHITFLTGSAGTGKTYVLNQFIQYLKKFDVKYAVTASTGIAATHIGGQTIHSWSGIGIKDKITKYDLENFLENERLYKRYQNTHVVIIDEISMLHASFLDSFDAICKTMKRNDKPFGGMQIIFCGDFFQLPPVTKYKFQDKNGDKNNSKKELKDDIYNPQKSLLLEEENHDQTKIITPASDYAFHSKAWRAAKPVVCYLTENYRQEDNTLLNILNGIREANEDIYESLESLHATKDNVLDNAVKLFTHNKDVDVVNDTHYKALEGTEYMFDMKESGKQNLIDNLKNNTLVAENLKLKIGTKVIFVKNNKEGKYQNGTLGVVTKLEKFKNPIVELSNGNILEVTEESWQIKSDDDKVLAEISQLPLRYAWAITIHKSQGMTLDAAEIDLSKGFGFGMGYVALSRVRSLTGLKLHGLNNQALLVSNEVLGQDNLFRQSSDAAEEKILKYNEESLSEMQSLARLAKGGRKNEKTAKEKKEDEEAKKEASQTTYEKTTKLIMQGKNIKEIAEIRNIGERTVIEHIIELSEFPDDGLSYMIKKIVKNIVGDFAKENNIKDKDLKQIKEEVLKAEKLKPIFDIYKEKYHSLTYDILKLIKIY
jgi:ATP-dependent exoDNAse (exonuclease V) alpha subunit